MGLFGGGRESLFKPGGTGRDIAGSIGDALMQMGGLQPIYAPAMQDRRRALLEEQHYQRRRADALEDWKTQQLWKQAEMRAMLGRAQKGPGGAGLAQADDDDEWDYSSTSPGAAGRRRYPY